MKVTETTIPDVKILKPKAFGDERGFFMESYNKKIFESLTGINVEFVQDNHSCSAKGVLRGLHYQIEHTQGKLVRVTSGEVFDVAVDLRKSSPTFGHWVGEYLNEKNQHQMWVPEKFAHGFLVLSESAELLYKTTDYYSPKSERCITWNDDELDIQWPAIDQLQLSDKDKMGTAFNNAEVFQ